MKLTKVFSINSILLILLTLFVFLIPNNSDYDGYRSYYYATNLSNFSQYSFDIGYTFITALSNSLNISFPLFWKFVNLLCVFVFFNFFFKESNSGKLTLSSFIIFSFIIIYPSSQNIFSNIVRNTLAISLCLYILSNRLPVYYYLIPPLFHISSIIFVFAVLLTKLFSKRSFSFVFLNIFLIIPILGIYFRNDFNDFLYELSLFRTIRNVLSADYYPSFRYLSYLLYINIIVVYSYISYHYLNGKLNNFKSKLFFNLKLKHIIILYFYFAISLFLYWLFYGIGTTSRILTFPIWISNSLLFSLIIKSFFYICISPNLNVLEKGNSS